MTHDVPCGYEDKYEECGYHVDCDRDCRALENPETLRETQATLEHYRYHSWLHGCSHGA